MRHCSHYINILKVLILLLFILPDSNAQAIRILPLGNSITEGTDGDPPIESLRIAYRFTLYSLLNSAGYNFDFVGHRSSGYGLFPDAEHGGIPGSRDQYVARLLHDGYDERWGTQTTPDSKPYLDVYPADIILLHIGTNDITHDEGTSPNSVAEILNEIDEWEARTGNEAIVLVARIINRKDYDLTTTQYNNNVAAMVAARNNPDIIMVDIENGAGINYPVDMQNDGIHPYESGYNKMAQKWFQAIQSLNTAPYFTSPAVTVAIEDELYSYTVTVEDDNPLDELTIYATIMPDWLTFTDNGNKTGLLSGTPGNNHPGLHEVSLMVSDGKVITTQDFTINVSNVNDPPQITGQYNMETEEDSDYSLSKEDLIIEDVDSSPDDIRLIILNGENYTVQGTDIIPEQDYYGSLLINLKATDQVDTSGTFQATLDVNPVNDPPEILGQKSTLEVKQFMTLTITAQDFYFEDVDNNINDLFVSIHPDPENIYTVNGNQIIPVKDTVGPIDVKVQLYDGEDISNEFLLQVMVLAPHSPPVFTTTPPMEAFVERLYFYVAAASDPDEGDILTYRASTLPDWLEFNPELKLLGGNPTLEDTGFVWVGIVVSDGHFETEQLYKLDVRLPTGIEERSAAPRGAASELIRQVYPVPAHDVLNLNLVNGERYQIQLLDISGRVMYEQMIVNQIEFLINIDVSKYKPGVYYIRVSDGIRSDSRKIMIVK